MRDSFRFLTVLLLPVAVCAVKPAQAGVYAFTDVNGVIHYTNVPTYPRYAEMQRVAYSPGPSARRAVRPGNPARFRVLVEEAAREHGLDEALLHAVITVESAYDPQAVSHRGAMGLMQLMPQTARRYEVGNSFDPAQNIRGGARYLRDLMLKFDNDLTLALAAYNAGEDAVARYGNRVPPYRETLSYVPRVLEHYRRHQGVAR